MPYVKEVFDVYSLEQAKHVVLTSDPNDSNKFERETKFLVDVIAEKINIDSTKTVLDFGCGMGRVAKEMIDRFDCKVFGLDISPSMLSFAKSYINNDEKFEACHVYDKPESIDVGMSILALQHAENPKNEIDNIVSCLKPGGIFILLNEFDRYVPSGVNSQNYVIWKNDYFNIFVYLYSQLKEIERVKYINNQHDIIFYRKPEK